MSRKRESIETLSNDVKAIFDVLNEGSDLAVALISSSYLDQCLISLLENKLIVSTTSKELLETVLVEYAARAKLAYAIGLLTKSVYQDLIKIAEIRNRFAHSHFSVSFEDHDIVELCKALKTNLILRERLIDGQVVEIPKTARACYCITVAIISQRILLDAHVLNVKRELDSKNNNM